MEQKSIVAIEIASSKLKGAVCNVDSDGTMTVLAVEEIAATDNVRYGRIQNVQEVSSGVNELIRKLENNPAVAPRKICAVAIPLGGRSLSGIPASATLHFPSEIPIVDETVRRLKQEAMKDIVSRKAVELILPRTFYVNNVQVSKPVGNFGKQLSGDFILLACSNENRRNLERVRFDNISPENVRFLLRPVALADFVLTDTEKQLGCVLVDFGAETTTISIYKDSAPAFLSTLPIGSRLITRDLMSGLNLTEERAEGFKTTIGNAFPEASAVPDDNPNAREVNGYVRARAGEIAANIVNQIVLSGYKNADLPGGIIIVGGGARLKNFDALLYNQCKLQVRDGSMPPTVVFKATVNRSHENIDVVSLLALAASDPAFPDCLTEPVREQIHPETVSTSPFDGDDSHDVQTPYTGMNRPGFPGHADTRADERRSYGRYVDEDNLLTDDKDRDSDATETTEKTSSGGFMSKLFGRKKSKKQLQPEEEPDPYELPEEEPEEEEPEFTDPEQPESINGMRKKISRWRNTLTNFYTHMPEEEEDPGYNPGKDED